MSEMVLVNAYWMTGDEVYPLAGEPLPDKAYVEFYREGDTWYARPTSWKDPDKYRIGASMGKVAKGGHVLAVLPHRASNGEETHTHLIWVVK